MMKKLILLLFALSFLFSCAGEKIDCEEKENETEEEKVWKKWNCPDLARKGHIDVKIK